MEEFLKKVFKYHPPKSDSQIERYTEIRSMGQQFAEVIDETVPLCEEKKVAIQKIREAVMWANAAIACNE